MEDVRAGRLLVATPVLGDPNFRRTVVLVVEDEPEEGTLGVVLNRPTKVPVGRVLEPWTDLVSNPSVVFRGGPVSALPSRVGLIDLDTPPQLVAGGIASFRVFAGYAGWGPGQLQAEIDEGAWYVLSAEPADVFDPEPEQLWRAVLRRSGGALALVATYPDDPALN